MSQLSDPIKEHNRRIAERDPEFAHEIDKTRRELRETPTRTTARVREETRKPGRRAWGCRAAAARSWRADLRDHRQAQAASGARDQKGHRRSCTESKRRRSLEDPPSKAKPVLSPAIRAVGRLEATNHPNFSWIGTAWLVAEDIVVTNRHVAREFARRKGDQFVFLQTMGPAMEVWIDFLEEFDNAGSLEFGFERPPHRGRSGPDMAFIRVRPDGASKLATPIELATGAAKDCDQVAELATRPRTAASRSRT